MERAELALSLIAAGEIAAGGLCVAIGAICLAAAVLAPDTGQTRLRSWVGAFCLVMGLEELVDAAFHEGDPAAMVPHALCTAVQAVTAAAALRTLLRVPWGAWRRSYER